VGRRARALGFGQARVVARPSRPNPRRSPRRRRRP